MATQQQQQQQSTSAPPPKDKKNKKRQKAAAEAAKNGASSSTPSTSNPAQSNSNTAAASPRRQRRSPVKRAPQPREPHEMYGVELPVPPSPGFSKVSAKGKEKAVEPNGSMEEGEVDPLEGLFFVDTKPRKLPKDLQSIEKPVLPRKKSPSPPPALDKSPSLPPQTLLEDKVVPDYVGTSSEIKEADVVKGDDIHPVEGSSKDLLNAIIKYSSFESSKAPQAEEQTSNGPSEDISAGNGVMAVSAESNAGITDQPSVSPEAVLQSTSTTEPFQATSPGGTKRKREGDSLAEDGASKRHATSTVLGDLMSDDDSTSSEEDEKAWSEKAHDVAVSDSEGDSSAQEDGRNDDLALNMEIDVVGESEPPLAMEVDLTGSVVPNDHATTMEKQNEESTGLFVTDTSGGANAPATNDQDDDLVAPEGVEDDEYTADRSRYFKEDDPLKLCARCGETGHTVRDCAHVQVRHSADVS